MMSVKSGFVLQEVAEPLMDLKHGIEELLKNKTFRYIISAILTIGNFLNGSQVCRLAYYQSCLSFIFLSVSPYVY